MITRLAIIVTVSLLATPLVVAGQQAPKVPRVGILSGQLPESPSWAAFREGLRERGYVEGHNVVIEWRSSRGRAELFPDLAAELVRLNVDVIVAGDNPAIKAAQGATRVIPIVMVLPTDPVGTGFVASLGRPGANITGLNPQGTELQSKRVQLLKEALPNISRVAVLWDPTEPGRRAMVTAVQSAAKTVGLTVRLLEVRSPAELDGIFTVLSRERVDAVLVEPSQVTFAHRARIAEAAARSRLPTMCWRRETVEAGCLLGYAANFAELFRRTAYFVDKVLKGSKPADLPVEQPTKFELGVNMKTAKALGLTITATVLARADHVIE